MTSPAQQGGKAVILTKGDMYFEVLAKEGDVVHIMGPTGGLSTFPIAELDNAGLVAKQAHKLIKTDGSWLYMTAGTHGTDLYLEGRHSPATPLGMKRVRTL